MTMRLDGELIIKANYDWVYRGGTPAAPAHILFDLAVGGIAGKNGVDDAALPQSLEIDYVRVYQRIACGLSAIGADLMPTGG